MNWEWDNTLEEILPDTARIDAFLKQLLPGQPVHIVDMMQEILQGNWVMEPMMFWKYTIPIYWDIQRSGRNYLFPYWCYLFFAQSLPLF